MNQTQQKSRRSRQRECQDLFWHGIKSERLLSHEETIALAEKVQAWRSLSPEEKETPEGKAIEKEGLRSKQKLITANMLLVVNLAHRFHKPANMTLSLDDLIQEGAIGLAHAIDLFNPKLNFHLSTYATWWIKQSIWRAIASIDRTIRVPVHVHDSMSKIRRGCASFSQKTGRNPSLSELASEIGKPVKEVETILQRMGQTNTFSLDRELKTEDQDGTLFDIIPDRNLLPTEEIDARLTIEQVERWVSCLPTEKQQYIAGRYLFGNAFGEELSFQTLAQECEQVFGSKITRQAVASKWRTAIAHIRRFAANEQVNFY